MYTRKQSHPVFAYLICVAAVAALAYLTFSAKDATPVAVSPTPSPTASASPSASPQASPTVSPTPTGSPSPSPSASVAPELPAAVASFYTAYERQDVAGVFADFTPASTNDERELLSVLRDGKDLNGIPGGPTVFQSASVTVTMKSIAMVSTTVTETVVNETIITDGVTATRRRTFKLLNGKITAYQKDGNAGKYSGFFN
ncbi:hypothetical protein BH11PAT4_BH11PAT4_1610 [soil metagenome]